MLLHQWNDRAIRSEVRNDRVWFCLTDMATANDKKVNDYLRLKSTQEYVEGLSSDTGIPVSLLISVTKGNFGDGEEQGTWAIDEIAIDFAQWVSTPFRIWVNRLVRDVMNQSVTPSENSKVAVFLELMQGLKALNALPEEDAISMWHRFLDPSIQESTIDVQPALQPAIEPAKPVEPAGPYYRGIDEWIAERVEFGEDYECVMGCDPESASQVYGNYCLFCQSRKIRPESLRKFSPALFAKLQHKGVVKRHKSTGNFVSGMKPRFTRY